MTFTGRQFFAQSLALAMPPVLAGPTIDGSRDDFYGEPLAVQTIETGFGDNQSEWNAAYGTVEEGRLSLLFTGNLEANFNKLEIFIDSVAGGFSVFPSQPGNDGSGAMAGMTFDTGFLPDYHLIARRGLGKFDLDIARLGTGLSSFYENVFGGGEAGSATTPSGPVNRFPIEVAYDNRNFAGIGGSAGVAANQVAARAVTTGLELGIALADLGQPSGEIRVMLLQNNQGHDYLSNQALAGLPVGTQNLQNSSSINFNNFAGDQFFTVPPASGPSQLDLVVTGFAGGTLTTTIDQIPPGQTFHFRRSTDGQTFSPFVPALDFTAADAQPFEIPGADPGMLIQVFEGPSER